MHKIDTRNNSTNSSLPTNPRMRNTDRDTLQKFLKEELRMTIMAKRHARGEGDLTVQFHEPEPHELSSTELERKERRREQNRRAAQRCRRKKRINQMSVLQNYDCIITHNQQLQQEVEQLRKETSQLQSLLKAHRDACTCSHTLAKNSLQALAPKVKVEPVEDSPAAQMGYEASPPPPVSLSPSTGSCQYGTSADKDPFGGERNSSADQSPHSYVGVCQGNYPQTTPQTSSSFPTTTCSYQPQSHSLVSLGNNQNLSLNIPGEPLGMRAEVPTFYPDGDFPGCVQATSFGQGQMGTTSQQHVLSSTPGSHRSHLDELAFMPGGLRSCVFQEEVATPLSADGRRSISSVSSDFSAASEQHSNDAVRTMENRADINMGDYVADDMTQNDVSQLLSQINQDDLILDDVFCDPMTGMTSLPQHFLQSI